MLIITPSQRLPAPLAALPPSRLLAALLHSLVSRSPALLVSDLMSGSHRRSSFPSSLQRSVGATAATFAASNVVTCAAAPLEGVPGSASERTFIAIKPDGVQRGLVSNNAAEKILQNLTSRFM